jgi:hypothetical protein
VTGGSNGVSINLSGAQVAGQAFSLHTSLGSLGTVPNGAFIDEQAFGSLAGGPNQLVSTEVLTQVGSSAYQVTMDLSPVSAGEPSTLNFYSGGPNGTLVYSETEAGATATFDAPWGEPGVAPIVTTALESSRSKGWSRQEGVFSWLLGIRPVAFSAPVGAITTPGGTLLPATDKIDFVDFEVLVQSASPPVLQYSSENITAGGGIGSFAITNEVLSSSFWASAASGNWSNSASWTLGVPNGDGAVAAITASTSSPMTVTLDQPVALGTLVLGSGTPGVGYTLSGGGSNTLTLSNTSNGAPAEISVNDGTHFIDVPVLLASNLVVTSSGSNPWTLTVGTGITDNGNQLSLTLSASNGTLILSGPDTYSGTNVTAGTLTVASPAGLADGSNLTVGADAAALFAVAVTPQAATAITAVPEPCTLVLCAAAVCGAAVYQGLRSGRKKQ